MTASDLIAFYTEHKKELVTLQLKCGDLFERVWMASCPHATYEGREMAILYTAPENDPTRPTHGHPVDAIDILEVIE